MQIHVYIIFDRVAKSPCHLVDHVLVASNKRDFFFNKQNFCGMLIKRDHKETIDTFLNQIISLRIMENSLTVYFSWRQIL
jgi:hypothetical protein